MSNLSSPQNRLNRNFKLHKKDVASLYGRSAFLNVFSSVVIICSGGYDDAVLCILVHGDQSNPRRLGRKHNHLCIKPFFFKMTDSILSEYVISYLADKRNIST